jgi:ribonuclease-3
LLEIFPDDKEGILDKKLASLVNRKKCCEISKKLNLGKYIITGNVKSKKNTLEDKIISDACEALIGAIYLDHGFNIVEKFIIKFWKNHMNMNIVDQIDAKTRLQEYSLKKYKVLPKYKLFSNTGPHHKPTFKIGVSVQNSKIIYASGNSKKDAEQNAAKLFLKQFGL